MKSVCLTFLLLVAVVQGGKVCTETSQCEAGECCQIMSEFMVVSKRQLLATKLPVKTGTCEKYKLEGDHCSSFAKINGYCSCEPGTHCATEEVPLPTRLAVSKRSMLPPKPGYQWISTCKKI